MFEELDTTPGLVLLDAGVSNICGIQQPKWFQLRTHPVFYLWLSTASPKREDVAIVTSSPIGRDLAQHQIHSRPVKAMCWQCKGPRWAKGITFHKCDKMCIHIHIHLYTNCKKSYLLSRNIIGTHTQFAKWNPYCDASVYIMTNCISDASFVFCHCSLYYSTFKKMWFCVFGYICIDAVNKNL